jgi:catechol 2,3-dioxygenase-like lactoylglutathione lyase family enzyme
VSGTLATTTIRPFVPGGKDFALSKRFYLALGFRITFEADQVAGFACDSGQFLLQDFHVKEWAENFMMQLVVADLDAWWAHIEALDLPGNFGVQPPRPPAMQPWGLRIAYVFDPSGVLWHIAQG